jgi:hypothetical protein
VSGARRALPFVLLAAGVLLIGVFTRNGRNEGEPLDPRSTGELGTRALVLLLGEVGADVRVAGAPAADDGRGGTALLLRDNLDEDETTRLRSWVERGGTLVVADPLSTFAPAIGPSGSGLFDVADEDDGLLRPACQLGAVSGIGRIRVEGAAPFRAKPGDVTCFPVHGGAYLVARPQGGGTIVALGGAAPFVNSQLDEEDNAGLAVALLAPAKGTRVTIVRPDVPGGGRRSLRDLVSRRVKDGLWQLVIAFALFALWRARRLGRPVLEPQPVQIPGSELVVAVGNLLQSGKRRDAAARMLRSALGRTARDRLGTRPDAPPAEIAAAIASRTGRDAAVVASTLSDRPIADDDALVALAREVEELQSEVTHVR